MPPGELLFQRLQHRARRLSASRSGQIKARGTRWSGGIGDDRAVSEDARVACAVWWVRQFPGDDAKGGRSALAVRHRGGVRKRNAGEEKIFDDRWEGARFFYG